MKKLLLGAVILLVAALYPVASGLTAQDVEPGPFDQTFMMVQFRADEELDAFEIWHIMGDFRSSAGGETACWLYATTVFKNWSGNSWQLLPWVHQATQVSKITPGVYRVRMTGRAQGFKSLEVNLRFNQQGKIVDISGTDPDDPTFRLWPDRKRKNRTVVIENPAPDLPNVSPGLSEDVR